MVDSPNWFSMTNFQAGRIFWCTAAVVTGAAMLSGFIIPWKKCFQSLQLRYPNAIRIWGFARGRLAASKYFPGKNFGASKITQHIWLGNVYDACRHLEELESRGITHILSAVTGVVPAFPNKFAYLTLDVRDIPGENLTPHFERSADYIADAVKNGSSDNQSNGIVLVHCMAGVSRSATILTAYLMRDHNLSVSAALQKLRTARPIVNPNPGFMIQLFAYEKKLKMERIARLYIDLNNQNNFDKMMSLFAEDVNDGKIKAYGKNGYKEIKEGIEDFHSRFDEVVWEIYNDLDTDQEGNRVDFSFKRTWKGQDGKRLQVTGREYITFDDDGKIIDIGIVRPASDPIQIDN